VLRVGAAAIIIPDEERGDNTASEQITTIFMENGKKT
jgi:hypothetical protein